MNESPHVWAVVRNSFSVLVGGIREVESLWDTEYGAEQRAQELNGDGRPFYCILGWDVRHADSD